MGRGGDLVQEDRAAICGLELSRTVAHRSGEGAAGVAEELAFQEVRGQGPAVDHHEGLLGPPRQVVDGTRENRLAGATLALDEDAGTGFGDGPCGVEDLPHARIAAHELAQLEALLGLDEESLVLPLQVPRLEGPAQGGEDLVLGRRAGDRLEGPLPHPEGGAGRAAEVIEEEEGDRRGILAEGLEQLGALELRIHEDRVDRPVLQVAEGRVELLGDVDVVARFGQGSGEAAAREGRQIQEEDAWIGHGGGPCPPFSTHRGRNLESKQTAGFPC